MTVTDHPAPADELPAAPAMVTCVFAVRRGSPAAGAPVGARGHARGGPVRLLDLGGGLWAVVQQVPRADFTEDALRRRLSDPAELETCARAHHAVVTAAAAGGPVVPLPLATLFADPDRAGAALEARRADFHAALDRVAGRAEWAVKVHVRRPDPAGAAGPAAGTDPGGAPPGSAGTGRAYLARVRGRERARHTRQDAALSAAQQVHEAAVRFAAASARRRPHGPEITGRDRHQVLNAAYLVDDGLGGDLAAAVRALAGECGGLGLEVEVSGPWAPYSFTGTTATPATAPGAADRTAEATR
jgi:Gas vesicle synthesis protein GvpL/GvpF